MNDNKKLQCSKAKIIHHLSEKVIFQNLNFIKYIKIVE
jgi:hypothetical protein